MRTVEISAAGQTTCQVDLCWREDPARDPAYRPTHPAPGHPDLTLKCQYPLPYSRDVGTFGTGPFDSDDARDLVDQLADRPGQRREVLDRLFFRVRDRPGLLDWEFSAGEVVAAAAIVAASLPGGEDIRQQLADLACDVDAILIPRTRW